MCYDYKKKADSKPYAVSSICQYLSAAMTFFDANDAFSKETLGSAGHLKLWGSMNDEIPPRPKWYSHFRASVERAYNQHYITDEIGADGEMEIDDDPEREMCDEELGQVRWGEVSSSSSSSSPFFLTSSSPSNNMFFPSPGLLILLLSLLSLSSSSSPSSPSPPPPLSLLFLLSIFLSSATTFSRPPTSTKSVSS